MKAFKKVALLSISLFSTFSVASAAMLTLAEDGEAKATIVLQENANERLTQAAQDLQHYLSKIAGVKIPLVEDNGEISGVVLNVGSTKASRQNDRLPKKGNPESYRITVRDNAIFFEGRYPTSSAFAVYEFLEKQLGVRWFAPGADWEFVPENPSPGTLVVDVKDSQTIPETSPRVWSGHDWTEEWTRWNLRNRTVQSERVPKRNFQNQMYRIFPPSKYAKSNPEYFPLVDGKRWIPPSDEYRNWWPSMGNEEVHRVTVKYIRDYFDENPESDSFSLGMDDIWYMCGDEKSRAMDASPEDYANKNFSSRFYKFINLIARELKKTHPDKYIGVLVYNITQELPADVPKIEDNVFGYMTETSALWYNPEVKSRNQTLTREWAKRMKHLSRYDYFGMGTFAPRVYPHLMAEQIKLDKSLGFEGMYVEVYTFLPHTAPMMWAFSKLQWNHQLDVDQLLEEFYQKMFGPAADTMKQYFSTLEKSWNEMRPGHQGWDHRNILRQAVSISPDAARKAKALIDEAQQQAKTDVEKRRLDVIAGGLQYANYAILGYDLANRIGARSVESVKDGRELLSALREWKALVDERDAFWPQARKRDDLLGHNLKGLYEQGLEKRGEGYLQTNPRQLDSPVLPGVLSLMEWYQNNSPEQLAAIQTEVTALLPDKAMAQSIQDFLWVNENRPASILKNGSFTAGQTHPSEWTSWARYGGAVFERGEGYNGKPGICVQSTSVAQGANVTVLKQEVALNGVQRVFATTWAKTHHLEKGELTLRFRNKKGWLKGEGSRVRASAFPQDGWQQIYVSAAVPADSEEVVLMLGVSDGAVSYSDVQLFAIEE